MGSSLLTVKVGIERRVLCDSHCDSRAGPRQGCWGADDCPCSACCLGKTTCDWSGCWVRERAHVGSSAPPPLATISMETQAIGCRQGYLITSWMLIFAFFPRSGNKHRRHQSRSCPWKAPCTPIIQGNSMDCDDPCTAVDTRHAVRGVAAYALAGQVEFRPVPVMSTPGKPTTEPHSAALSWTKNCTPRVLQLENTVESAGGRDPAAGCMSVCVCV